MGEDMEKLVPLYTAGGNVNGPVTWEYNLTVSFKS